MTNINQPTQTRMLAPIWFQICALSTMTFMSASFSVVCCSALQVLVFSTRLLRPTDIPELLFSTQRLVPDVGV